MSGRTIRWGARSTIAFLLLAGGRFALSAAAEPDVAAAARGRDMATVRLLLKQRADVNKRQGDGTTALHWAVHWDDTGNDALLIGTGAIVRRCRDLGVTPLSLACTNGSAAMAATLHEGRRGPECRAAVGRALSRRPRARKCGTVKLLVAAVPMSTRKEKTNRRQMGRSGTAQRRGRVLLEHRADVGAPSAAGRSCSLPAGQSRSGAPPHGCRRGRECHSAGSGDALLVDRQRHSGSSPARPDGRHQALAFYPRRADPRKIGGPPPPLRPTLDSWCLMFLARRADPRGWRSLASVDSSAARSAMNSVGATFLAGCASADVR